MTRGILHFVERRAAGGRGGGGSVPVKVAMMSILRDILQVPNIPIASTPLSRIWMPLCFRAVCLFGDSSRCGYVCNEGRIENMMGRVGASTSDG